MYKCIDNWIFCWADLLFCIYFDVKEFAHIHLCRVTKVLYYCCIFYDFLLFTMFCHTDLNARYVVTNHVYTWKNQHPFELLYCVFFYMKKSSCSYMYSFAKMFYCMDIKLNATMQWLLCFFKPLHKITWFFFMHKYISSTSYKMYLM